MADSEVTFTAGKVNKIDVRNKVLDIIEMSKRSLSIPEVIQAVSDQSSDERIIREAIQYLVDQGPLMLDAKFKLQLIS